MLQRKIAFRQTGFKLESEIERDFVQKQIYMDTFGTKAFALNEMNNYPRLLDLFTAKNNCLTHFLKVIFQLLV